MIGWDTQKIKKAADDNIFLCAADTLAELAHKVKISPDQLQQTIRDFNKMVDNGVDDDYGREYLNNKVSMPPFYALKVHASVLVTFGGIKVNDQLQVVDHDGHPLEGLYAAGEILGLGATSGKAFCSGMAITPALSFGRWLGEHLS